MILIFTACASARGNDELPAWDGISYTESDPDERTGRFAEVTYRRSSLNELKSRTPKYYSFDGSAHFNRTNVGLLDITIKGFVQAYVSDNESNDAGNNLGIDSGPSPVIGDFNNDGLTDVIFAHNFGPNTSSWLPKNKPLVLVNQGNGRLEVDPSVFVDSLVPSIGPLFISHVGDFNGDGKNDFINIGESGVFLLSSSNGLVNQTPELQRQLLSFGAYTEAGHYEIWTHTTSIGDLDNDGTLDMFVPSPLRDRDCAAIYGCTGFTMLNDGQGNFALGSIKLPDLQNVYASAISDFDNDGYADIALSLIHI